MAAGSHFKGREKRKNQLGDRQATGLTYEFGVPRFSGDFLLRAAAVLSQSAMILLTWQLWNVRQFPADAPLLPALDGLPQWPMGAALLASLALVIAWPRVGVWVHATLLTLAMLMDQTRIQPECVSMVLLMVGSLPSPGAKLIGRSHLIALWFFSGFHKFLSASYYTGVIRFLLLPISNSFPSPLCHIPPAVYYAIGVPCALFEMTLGVMAVVPRTRRLAAVLGAPMHAILFLWLSLAMRWNSAVWSWNLALIVAGFALLWNWRTTWRADWRNVGVAARAAALFLLLSPIGYYFGLIDGFLAHCVYSNNVPEAQIFVPNGDPSRPIYVNDLTSEINVAVPPAPRLFEQYFEIVALPGWKLVIEDPRLPAMWNGREHREIVKRESDDGR